MSRKLLVLGVLFGFFYLNYCFAQNQQTLAGPKGEIRYDLTGESPHTLPCYIDAQGVQHKIGSGWISNAILKQLQESPELLSASSKIVSEVLGEPKTKAAAVMYEIIQGAGYWLDCPPPYKEKGDVKYVCTTVKVEYKLFVDTQKGYIYVAEIQEGTVKEIKFVHIGKRLFELENESESYEAPDRSKPFSCQDSTPKDPGRIVKQKPLAIINATPTIGDAPLTVVFDGKASRDRDEEGKSIISYAWDLGERGTPAQSQITHTFTKEGTYSIKLRVVDNEKDSHDTTVNITVLPAKIDTCFTMIYTISKCEGRLDTLDQTSIRVHCDDATEPKITWVPCPCCENEPPPVPQDTSGFILAGGPVYIQNDGQLLEYALGLDIQIRYPFSFRGRDAFHFVIDGTYFPNRRANPLDDRPHLWNRLYRDRIDPNTGLPLNWFRGTRRGTASAAIGMDYKPIKKLLLKGLYMQGLFGFERTFNQIEASDVRKDPSNEFIGFDLGVFFVETRLGLRKKHLEVFLGGRFLEESRPFTFVPPNPLGGTHHKTFDNTIHAGVAVWY